MTPIDGVDELLVDPPAVPEEGAVEAAQAVARQTGDPLHEYFEGSPG